MGVEPNWLQELETWSQRSKVQLEWLTVQLSTGGWSAQPVFNKVPVAGIIGMGESKQQAKQNAVRDIEAAQILVILAA
ncbi:hypothetical protein FRC06_007340 [Ceratobasidium sp. 370]|nr:hypothetical protein FRC06_007340 [Ceratobasidium sp. 370]